LEPRGHSEMYGALLLNTVNRNAVSSGILFMQNFGYSPMCGHATLALARYFADKLDASITKDAYEVEINLEVPCGIVKSFVAVKDTDKMKKGDSRFISVEAYAAYKDVDIQLSTNKWISVDIAYGGAYYAIVPVESVGIVFGQTSIHHMIEIAAHIKKEINENEKIEHPLHQELSFLYGVIFTNDTNLKLTSENTTRSTVNVTIFEDGQVDRSPTGSGVTARMALLHERGLVQSNETITFISGVNNSKFQGKVVQEVQWCHKYCVKVEVKGKAFYCGHSEFTYEDNDPLAFGFRV